MSISQNFPNTRPSLNLNFARSKTLDPRITFTRTSTATYVDESGVIRTAAADEPRFDHDPVTGECLGLLIEEQRENLVSYSEQFDNVTWTTTYYTVGIDSTTAPDGTTSAEKFIRDTTNTQAQINRNITGISTNTTYTLSCFCKSAEWSKIGLREGFSTGDWATFDLSLGEEIDTDSGVTTTIDPYPNEWYRISMTMTTTGTQTSYGVRIIPLPDSYTSGTPYVNQSGNDVDGLYLWGAQLEAGAFPTSYIPTSGSTATRTADNAKIEGSNFSSWYNPNEGAVYTDTRMVGVQTTRFDRIWAITNSNLHEDGTGIFINGISTPNGAYDIASTINGTSQVSENLNSAINLLGITAVNTPKIKICLAFSKESSNISYNGKFPKNNDITITDFADYDRLFIGQPQRFQGYSCMTVSQLTYYPVRLSNEILQTLTK